MDCQLGPARRRGAAPATEKQIPKTGSAPGQSHKEQRKVVALFFKDSPAMSQSQCDVKTASRVMNSGLAMESREGGFQRAACCSHTAMSEIAMQPKV